MTNKLAQFRETPRHSILPLLIVAALSISSQASAGDILFVSDSETDAINIPAVLSGQDPNTAEVPCDPAVLNATCRDGTAAGFHKVVIIRDDYQVEGGVFGEAEGTNPTLAGDLFGYCSVFWSASGPHQPLGLFPDRATNGNFEDINGLFPGGAGPILLPASDPRLAGWTIVSPVTWHIGTPLSNDASAGVAYVDLASGGSSFGQISQMLATEPFTTYKLSIDAQGDAPLVALNSTFIPLSAESTSDGWTTYTATYMTPTATTRVDVTSSSAGGSAAIDNFSFVQQPQPAFPDLGADGGLHTDENVFRNLEYYVRDGGYVFVTGHDAVAHPDDYQLVEFVGGVGAGAGQQVNPSYSSINTAITTALSGTGAVGTPSGGGINQVDGVQEQDYLAMVATGTTMTVLVTDSGPGISPAAAAWTVRHPYGAADVFTEGQIAYVANGVFLYNTPSDDPPLSNGEDPSWLTDPYRSALLNFAANSCGTDPEAQKPIANSQSVVTTVDTPVLINLTGSDPQGQALSFVSNTPTTSGTLTDGPSAGDPIPTTVTYNPGAGFIGNDSFDFVIEDEDGNTSLPGTINIEVIEQPPEPVFEVDAGPDVVIDEGSGGAFASGGSFSDPGPFAPHTATVDYDDGMGSQGLTLNGNLFDLGATYTPDDDGVFLVTVEVTNSDFPAETVSDTAAFIINNVAPTVDAGTDTSGLVGELFERSGSFADPGTEDSWTATVDYGDGGGASSLTLDSDNMTFDLSHTYSSAGDFEVTVVVTDDDGGMGSATFMINVSENSPPDVAADNPSVTVDEGQGAANTGTFSDAGDEVVISASIGSVSQTGTESGTWSWSLGTTDGPGESQTVTITATDSADATSTTTFELVVNNVAPTVAADVATVTVDEGQAAANTGTFNDVGADDVTITASIGSISQGAGNSGTWGWSFGTTDGPDESQTVTVTATDGDGALTTTTFELVVENVAPDVAADSAAVTVDEGDTANNSGTFADAGDDIVSVTASVGTLVQAGTQSGTWTWSLGTTDGPDDSQTVTITATDSDGATNTTTFDLFVDNVTPDVSTGLDVTIDEGDTFMAPGSFTDPGDDTWTGTVDYGDGAGPLPVVLNPDKSFALSHTYTQDGIYTVTSAVTDSDGATGMYSIIVTVLNVAPLVSPDVASVVVDEGLTASNTGTFADVGDDVVTISASVGTVVQTGTQSGTWSWSYGTTDGPDQSNLVAITATDSSGGVGRTTFELVVNNVAPAVDAGPDGVIDEGDTFVSAGSFVDPGADIWTATVDYGDGSGPQALSLNPDGSFALSHAYADDGVYNVTVAVTDDDGGVGSDSATVTVNNVAPSTDAGPDQGINEGGTYVSAGSFTDPGADTWTATVDYGDGSGIQPLPLNPDMSFVLSHTYLDDGVFTVTVTVTDDEGGAGSDTAIVTVQNLPPTVAANAPTVTVNEGAIAANSGTFADSGDDTVAITASIGGISQTGTQSGTWSWAFTTLDGPDQTQTVTVTATDSDGAASMTTFDLVVLNVPPVANDDIYGTDEDTPLIVPADGVLGNDTDPGLDMLSASVTSPPSNGMLVLNTDGSFTYTPDPNWFGADSFTYSATDDDLASDTATVTINVAPVNDPPVLSVDFATQSVQYSDGISPVTITAADIDSVLPPVSLSYGALPTALSVSAGTCAVDNTVPAGTGSSCTWTLSGNATVGAGTYPINFSVDDSAAEFNTDNASTEVVVVQEDATGLFDGDNPSAVLVDGDGSDSSLPFTLTVHVSETVPDFAANGLTAAGDIGLADVVIDLVPVGPGGTVSGTGCTRAISGAGYLGVLEVTCGFSGIPVNTYSIEVTIDGSYYTGSAEDVVTVFDPSLGFASGGGWFYWPGTMDKTNYGFTMKYGKNGRNVKGNMLVIRHLADGTNHRFKSNALGGLAVGEGGSPSFGWASFTGKGTYRAPGWEDAIGNHEFTVYVEDHGEPGADADRIWVEVLDKSDLVVPGLSIAPPATDNAEVIDGGNIVVPHANSGGKK